MTMLKVLSIPDPLRAGESDVRRCAAIAAQGGIEIVLLLPQGAMAAGQDCDGVRLRFEPARRRAAPWASASLRDAAYPGLRAVLRQTRPDVIHLHASPRSTLALAVARLCGDAALVLECEDEAPSPKLLSTWRLRLGERRVLRATDFVLARHYGVLSWARANGFSGPGGVVAYGVDASGAPPDDDAPDRAPGLVLGYIGALTRESSVVDVVEAVAVCRAPITLHVLGRGPLDDEIRDRAAALRIADRVHIVGAPASTRGRVDFLRKLGALVVTRHLEGGWRETADREIAEAQARGVPVIAFGVPGGRELVGDTGWWVPEGDAGLLSRQLLRLANSPDEVARAAAACISHVQWFTSLDVVAPELCHAFAQAKQSRAGHKPRAGFPLATSEGAKL